MSQVADALTVNPFIDPDQFTADIEANQDDISEAMRKQTQLCAYYGMFWAKSQRQLQRLKLVDKTLRAQLGKSIRAEIVAAGDKPTAPMVAELIDTDAKVQRIALLLVDATEVETICKVAYYAFKTRTEMLVSLGNMQRASMRAGVVIRDAKAEVESYHERRASRSEQFGAGRRARLDQGEADAA